MAGLNCREYYEKKIDLKRSTPKVLKALDVYWNTDHPNVVKLLHTDRSKHRVYFEKCHATLSEIAKEKYKGNIPSKRNVLLQLARGLHAIHEKSLIYGKVWPESAMICNGVMKWIDNVRWTPPKGWILKTDVYYLGALFMWYLFTYQSA